MKFTPIKELEKEIEKIPEGYTGNTNYLKEHILKAKLQTLKQVEEISKELIEVGNKEGRTIHIGELLDKIRGADKGRMEK